MKESESLELDGVFRSSPGRFVVTNLSARWIIRYAYRRRDDQVVGAPAWTERRYQIGSWSIASRCVPGASSSG